MENLSPFYDTFHWAMSNTWPMLILFIVIISVLRVSKIIIGHEKFVFYDFMYNLIFTLYLLLLYYLLLSTENAVSYGVNLIPFHEMTRFTFGSKAFMYNVIGNIVMFIPFGFYISKYIKASRTWQVLLITFIVSLTAECIQYYIGRAFDIDDVMLNVVGSIIGFLIYLFCKWLKNKLPSFMKTEFFYNLIAVIFTITIIIGLTLMWRGF